MKFMEMCEDLFEGKHKYAVRKSYPTLLTTVRVKIAPDSKEPMLFYYDKEVPQIPFVVTHDTIHSDDWETFDDMASRLNIANYVEMPNAKDFLSDLNDSLSTAYKDGNFSRPFKDGPNYALRFQEAVALGIIVADRKSKAITFTDLGRSLVKTL